MCIYILSKLKFHIQNLFFILSLMISDLKARPQSKSIVGSIRPTSRHLNQSQAQEYFKKGKNEQSQNNFQKAIEFYVRATAYDTNYFQAYCNMGSCLRALGRYIEAKNQYKKSISIKPDDSISRYNLANVQRIIGNYEQSIEHYDFVLKLKQEKSIDIGSLYLNSLINIGICYKNKGQIEKAISYFEKANLIDQNDEGSIFNQAMCLKRSLKAEQINEFKQVSKTTVQKALSLFQRVLKLNPNNFMARISQLELSCFANQEPEKINQSVSKLKSLLNEPQCTLKDQVNEAIANCLKILKDYQNSSKFYQESLNDINKRKQSLKIIEGGINQYDVNSNVNQQKKDIKTPKNILNNEAEGLQFIEQNTFEDSIQKIKEIKDSEKYKHILELILYLRQAEKDQDSNSSYKQKACEIYKTWFSNDKAKKQFSDLSLEGHRAIGKVLKILGFYKQSILHFQHISNEIKNPKQNAIIHNSLAEDYEAMGLPEKALQEYQTALNLQPNNYSLVYNMGCCLNDNGNKTESLKYFQKFLVLIQKQTLDYQTKDLYIADCCVTMALCSNGRQNQFELYNKAFTKLNQLDDEIYNGRQFQQQILLNFYLRYADLLQTHLITITDKKSQKYRQYKQKLLETYLVLIELPECPDKDPIIINSANMYYEQKLYLNAVQFYKKVQNPENISYSNIALAYLHLAEHVMASKYISIALEQQDSALVKFNFDVISWIYGMATQQNPLYIKYPCQSQQSLLIRFQYGVGLIDQLSLEINNKSDEEIQKTIDYIIKNEDSLVFENQNQNQKLKIMRQKLKQQVQALQHTTSQSQITDQLIKLCFNKSSKIEEDFRKLISLLKQIPKGDKQISNFQALLSMFLFNNNSNPEIIRKIMKQHIKTKFTNININLEKIANVSQEVYQIQHNAKTIRELINQLKSWQCALESPIVSIIKNIEKIYYRFDFRAPLEIQNNFPRHFSYRQCDYTFNRIVYVIYKILKYTKNFTINNSNLKILKQNIFKDLERNYQRSADEYNVDKIQLSDQFLPTTIFAFHKSKEDCLLFIEQLQKLSNHKQKISVSHDCQGINLILNKVVKLHCQWKDEDYLQNIFKSFSESPIGIIQQSIIVLQSQMSFFKQNNFSRMLVEANGALKY